MESILARALEYTLKYWLKSFTRDQFKLQGRTVQLSNLGKFLFLLRSIGEHYWVSIVIWMMNLGLPPALNVATAKVGKLEIMLPSVSNVQIEPIVVQIDRLDLVLEENDDLDACKSTSSVSSPSSGKGSGYGFADKIADGMTLEVRTVNLLLETHGGARKKGGATWASPMASITIRNLLLYTTNESWQVVNLKEARDFSSNAKFIYVFKKLEWESLSIDLLPHPDMFADANFASSEEGSNKKDDDGAKRVFFGGERFIEGISGQANASLMTGNSVYDSLNYDQITIQRTELNSPLGLEVQLHITEAQDLKTSSVSRIACSSPLLYGIRSTEAAGRSLVAITVDHIFLCVKDSGESFCPPIYPLGDQPWQLTEGVPLICLHLLQIQPSPSPPAFASRTVVDCQPIMIHLQEESCLKIASLLADGIVVNPGSVLPDFSVNSVKFNLKGLDITVPMDMGNQISSVANGNPNFQSPFCGARLHIENLFFFDSPSLKLKLLNLEKDPACFCLWECQPVDASQKKWTTGASLLSLSLETCNDSTGLLSSLSSSSGLWRCAELKDASVEVAMATVDGCPLINVPPPGGLVRVGVACQQYFSNTSVEQLFFVLDLYAYFGRVAEKITIIRKSSRMKGNKNELLGGRLIEKVPSDTAVSLAVKELQLRFLESSSQDIQGMPLVQFLGENLFIRVTHRTLGGAIAISSSLCWESVEVDCADTGENLSHENGVPLTSVENGLLMARNGCPQLRTVFWVQKKPKHLPNGTTSLIPFLDITMVHVIPYRSWDMECHSLSLSACIAGVRLGGGMNYAEALLHQFGILGPDGGPGKGLSKGLDNLSAGPLSKLFKPSHLITDELQEGDENDSAFLHLGPPDDVDLSIELKDWLFALEGAQNNGEGWCCEDLGREERCWHTTFQSLQVRAKSSPKHVVNGKEKSHGLQRYPVELVTVGVEGMQILKPQTQKHILRGGLPLEVSKEAVELYGGINLEVCIVISEDDADVEMVKWVVDHMKFSVKHPIEAVVTKDELQHLAFLCKSEVDSMGRLTAGVLRVLKLEGSIGQAAIKQLSNLGSESFAEIFIPEKLSRGSSIGSIGLSPPSNVTSESPSSSTLESTVASLEEVVLDSQAKCAALTAELCSSGSSLQHLAEMKKLTRQLETLQSLLARLRTQI
ncbi:hypothetical protein U1Q18_000551 [Sarracenia purpurea var. burkii]